VAVPAAQFDEGAAVLHVAPGRIDLPLLAVLRHAIALEIAQVRVHCVGADELPSPGGSGLRVELHNAGLDRDPPRPRANPAVPAPGAPVLEYRCHRRASATGIEPAASLSGRAQPVGVAARAPNGMLRLPSEAGRAGAHTTGAASARSQAAPIPDLARADAEVVVIVSHETTIGSLAMVHKRQNATVVEWRRRACASVAPGGRVSERRRSEP
jgi:hypothetical protein